MVVWCRLSVTSVWLLTGCMWWISLSARNCRTSCDWQYTHIEHLGSLLLYFKVFHFVSIARNNFVKYEKTLCGKQCLDFESALCFTYQWEHVICIWQQYSDWNLIFSHKSGALHLGHNENVLFHLGDDYKQPKALPPFSSFFASSFHERKLPLLFN